MTRTDGAVLVLTTTSDDACARVLARTLVEERLAACVTRSGVRSVFRWDECDGAAPASFEDRAGSVNEEDEVLLVIKTARSRVVELERRLLQLHSYECPEIVRIEPEHVDAKYLAWLVAACAERK